MQTSQSNDSTNSTPASPLKIKIEEQENGETWVSISPTPQLAPPPSPPRMTTRRPPIPKTRQEGWDTKVGLPTSPPYRSQHEWEEAERKERARQEHDQLSWTACYDDGCQTHFQDKEASGWFPQDQSQSVPLLHISRNNKRQERKYHESRVTWDKCYEDKCFSHTQEKMNAGYYPQKDGRRIPLSRWHKQHPNPEQRRKVDTVRTRLREEGSEKTQPDVRALQRQVQELRNEKDQLVKNEDEFPRQIADQQSAISRMRQDIQGFRRTVAGSGFSQARLRSEMDTRTRANEELEHRNHSLCKELRRAGQRLLDLGK